MTSARYSLVGTGNIGEVLGVGMDTYHSPFSSFGKAHYVWSSHAHPLSQILKDNSLPLVVKLSEDAIVKSGGDDSINFRQPLLLFREHQLARLYARSVTKVPQKGSTSEREVGPYLVLPQDYPGLFRPAGQIVAPLTTVSTLARLMPSSFLSTLSCKGYTCVSPIESDTVYQKSALEAGVYVVKDLLEEEILVLTTKGKSEKHKLLRCLRCETAAHRRVLFPLKTVGEFYIVSIGTGSFRNAPIDPSTRVYSWTELTKPDEQDTKSCNITAQLMHGNPPSQECNFTGVLAFKHVTKDHTVVGCTISDAEQHRLFELSVTRGPNFVVALNQDSLNDVPAISNSLKFARQEFDRYFKEIKVKRDYDVTNKLQ